MAGHETRAQPLSMRWQQSAPEPEPGTGVERSIRPGVPIPETVLVAVMADGSYLLMAYPQQEPAAFLAPDDAGPLREVLTAAFGSPADRNQQIRNRH